MHYPLQILLIIGHQRGLCKGPAVQVVADCEGPPQLNVLSLFHADSGIVLALWTQQQTSLTLSSQPMHA